MIGTSIETFLTEERLLVLLEQFRALGPLPGILLTFMKSFIPPLPTLVIVGVNAAVYGLWFGFLYSWLGLVGGCMVTFLIAKKIAGSRYIQRWAERPKVRKSLVWARRNAFSFVFLLSMLPVGPFVVINIAAAVVRMRALSFFIAVAAGKALMVLAVSYLGYDVERLIRHPEQLLYIALLIAVSLWLGKKLEAYFTSADKEPAAESEGSAR